MGVGVLGLVVLVIWLFVRDLHPTDARSRLLRRTGFVMSTVLGGFAVLFLVGETFDDPGGLAAVGLIALWATPMAALITLAWWRPDMATRVLEVVVGAIVVLGVWEALDAGGWRSFEDRRGPVRSVVIIAVTAVLTVLGLKRTRTAGVLLLIVGLVPPLLASFGARGSASLAAVSVWPVVTGSLYVLSAAVGHKSMSMSTPPAAGGSSPPRPKAA